MSNVPKRSGGLEVVEGRKGQRQIMVVAGEASSDQHGAELVRSLKRLFPEVEIFGMGGSELRAAGMELIVDSEKTASVMGFVELLGSLRKLTAAFRTLVETAKRRKPSVVVLVDFPDFNLRLAKIMHRAGIPVLYFVTPQLWAWRRGRVRAMKRDVRKVVPIFPFEESFFHQHGVDAEYVGHPFSDRPPLAIDRQTFLAQFGLAPELPYVALLPGSRRAEVERLLEPMLAAFRQLRASRPGFHALLPVPHTLDINTVKALVGETAGVTVVQGQAREVLTYARIAIVASGTATIEAAFADVPMVVVYRLARLSHVLARLLVRGVKHFAMVNLVAGKSVVPELLQGGVTGERLFQEIEKVLGDPKAEAKQREGLALVRARLGHHDTNPETTADRVAKIVLDIAEGRARRGAGSKRVDSWRQPVKVRQ